MSILNYLNSLLNEDKNVDPNSPPPTAEILDAGLKNWGVKFGYGMLGKNSKEEVGDSVIAVRKDENDLDQKTLTELKRLAKLSGYRYTPTIIGIRFIKNINF